MGKRKNREKEKLVVYGYQVFRHSGGFMPISFKTGPHMTDKDRPRKRISRHVVLDD